MKKVTMPLMRKAITLFRNPHINKGTQRYNQWMWLRAVVILGDRWVLAKPVERSKTQ